MERDPTQRFSSRVEDYVRYRPSWPRDVIILLERECGLTADSVVADIGSGTGLLAELFLSFGCEVFGVEPNREMRLAGERFLARYARFHSVNGRAEETGLPGSSVDLITAGQAFHWFEPERAREEFRRIGKPGAWAVLLWNERGVSANRFLAGYEDLLHQYAPEYKQVDHRQVDAARVGQFFGHAAWRLAMFPNEQRLDLDGVRGRLHSSSYAPQPGSPGHDEMIRDLDSLFTENQESGVVSFEYETKINYGRI